MQTTESNGLTETRPPLRPSRSRIIAVIPAYNEERFIGSVVLRARRHAAGVLVIDDGSTDATAEVATAAGAIVLRHETNCGKGVALSTGFQHALDLQPDAVITIDADGQHPAHEIDAVAAPVLQGEADIVIGSRYVKPSSYIPRHRIWGHRLFNLLTNVASRVSVSDSQSGFRAFSYRALQHLSFQSSSFAVESEMQFLAHENGLKILEVPITINYFDRPKRPVIAHGLVVLNGLLQLMGQYRPLLFLGVPGLAILLAGAGCGAYIVNIYRRRGELAVGYALICLLLVIVGNIAITTGIILHSVRGLLLQHFLHRDKITIVGEGATL